MTSTIINEMVFTNHEAFKNPKLETITNKIAAIYAGTLQYATDRTIEISKLLGQVKTEKLYVDDGYKSVEEYANAIFGIGKSTAYARAAYGEMLNNPESPDELKGMPQSNYAAIASVPMDKLKEAVAQGKINKNMTQEQLKEFARSTKKKKVDMPKLYDAYFVHGPLDSNMTEEMYVKKIWEEYGDGPEDWDNPDFERRANLVYRNTEYGDMNRNYFPTYYETEDSCKAHPLGLPMDSWMPILTRYYQWAATGKSEDGSLCEVIKISKVKYRFSKANGTGELKPSIERRLLICGDYCTIVEFHPHKITPVSEMPKVDEPKLMKQSELMDAILKAMLKAKSDGVSEDELEDVVLKEMSGLIGTEIVDDTKPKSKSKAKAKA